MQVLFLVSIGAAQSTRQMLDELRLVTQGLDMLSADTLGQVLESTTQAVQLQLNAPALSTWLLREDPDTVNLWAVDMDPVKLAQMLGADACCPAAHARHQDSQPKLYQLQRGHRLPTAGARSLQVFKVNHFT